MALIIVARPLPAFAQEFTAGFELVVKQHPTEVDPIGILELRVWADRDCGVAGMVLATGGTNLILSHPVVSEDPFSGAWAECRLSDTSRCQIGIIANPPTATGVRVETFNFAQTLGGDVSGAILYYDNPLHVMDIYLRFDDLTPRDVTVHTYQQVVSTTCVLDGMAPWPTPASSYVEFETVFHVSGGGPCRADFDGDGELTIFDFLAFQNAFDAGDLTADFDGDGELTIFDFLAFQNAFDAGCE